MIHVAPPPVPFAMTIFAAAAQVASRTGAAAA
jgi:hypothetical protein